MSGFKRSLEKLIVHRNHKGDFLTLEVHKNCEHPDHYLVASMELQMWQSKKGLVEWLRWCADRIEKDLPVLCSSLTKKLPLMRRIALIIGFMLISAGIYTQLPFFIPYFLIENKGGSYCDNYQSTFFNKLLIFMFAGLLLAIAFCLTGYGMRKGRDRPGYGLICIFGGAWPLIWWAVFILMDRIVLPQSSCNFFP